MLGAAEDDLQVRLSSEGKQGLAQPFRLNLKCGDVIENAGVCWRCERQRERTERCGHKVMKPCMKSVRAAMSQAVNIKHHGVPRSSLLSWVKRRTVTQEGNPQRMDPANADIAAFRN